MKLLLIEGIPGSGKTRTSEIIKAHYEALGNKVSLYQEGDLHPVDLAWCSVFTESEYEHVLNECDDILPTLTQFTSVVDSTYIVAYTKLGLPMKDPRIIEIFEPKEIYGGKVSKEDFMVSHQKLWHRFLTSVTSTDVVIFECAYLQNHVNELMLMYDTTESEIINHLKSLIMVNHCFDIEMFYLDNENVKETIDRVSKERQSSDKSKWDDWIDLVIAYIENSPYGSKIGQITLDDVYQYFEKRVEMDYKVIKNLPIKTHIINNPNFNYTERTKKIIALLT